MKRYVINFSIRIPIVGMAMLYVLPLLTTVFWFYLGRQYARSTWKTLQAILIGNATGVISLLIYLWQFLWKTAETRNLTLAAASQMFSASAPTYLLARIAVLFETRINYTGKTAMVALQVLAVVYMAVVFCVALLMEKKNQKVMVK